MQICSNILEEALAINDSITGSDPVTLREKRVNTILLGREKEKTEKTLEFIDSLAVSSNPDSLILAWHSDTTALSINQPEEDTLLAVAQSCPFEWGNVVHRTRAAASLKDTLGWYMHDCEIAPLPAELRLARHEKEQKNEKTKVSIFPNPFKEELIILIKSKLHSTSSWKSRH